VTSSPSATRHRARRITIACEPAATFEVSRRVADALAGQPPPLIAIALKLAGELAVSAVDGSASGQTLELLVGSSPTAIRIEVRGEPSALSAVQTETHPARFFLDRLADQWGTGPDRGSAWFELDRRRKR
jgi:hypothetical protein